MTKHRTEQSAIDIVLFSGDMLAHLVNIEIDENRKYVLTKVVNNKKGTRIQESDHNPIITEFKLQQKETKEDQKLELYNLRNKECQKKFKEYTTNTKMLSTVFDAEEDIDVLTKRFLKKLDGCIAINFKKIRVNKRKTDKGVVLFSRLQELNNKEDIESKSTKETRPGDLVGAGPNWVTFWSKFVLF